MAITEQEISRLAKLSGLRLNTADQQQAQQDLERIFGLIEQLQSVDTSGVEPISHPLSARQEIALRLHADEPTEAQSIAARDACLQNAPAPHAGLFLVPTVIE